ncbi:PAS domain-containing protein [Flagellimonas sp. HMM57]|uniref:PAS domain-containing protein n=1 Tax=unclassified Flagellimonas TaxID=2644544 RepID=UPI0013D41BDD|nr:MULTISPECIES: PAS domain-containing protein [unclassified Flagellimonas]UII76455.1 PAS domain-containing protein [Flagellimonas sp. HMM57]
MSKDISTLDKLMLYLTDKSETSIFQTLPKSYIVLNLVGRILGYNSKFMELMGGGNNEEETLNVDDFLSDYNKKRFMIMLELVELKGHIDDFELEMTRPDGSMKIVWISASAIYDSNKEAIAFHCIISDMTKEQMFLGQIKEELQTFSLLRK